MTFHTKSHLLILVLANMFYVSLYTLPRHQPTVGHIRSYYVVCSGWQSFRRQGQSALGLFTVVAQHLRPMHLI